MYFTKVTFAGATPGATASNNIKII